VTGIWRRLGAAGASNWLSTSSSVRSSSASTSYAYRCGSGVGGLSCRYGMVGEASVGKAFPRLSPNSGDDVAAAGATGSALSTGGSAVTGGCGGDPADSLGSVEASRGGSVRVEGIGSVVTKACWFSTFRRTDATRLCHSRWLKNFALVRIIFLQASSMSDCGSS